jgi:hypothetical protein
MDPHFKKVPGDDSGLKGYLDQATAIWILKNNVHLRNLVEFERSYCINCDWCVHAFVDAICVRNLAAGTEMRILYMSAK